MNGLDKWDERFMQMANAAAEWSKDPGTKVGAVLVVDRRIIATGYNGFPKGIDDSPKRYEDRDLKLSITVHAEINAILNAAAAGASTKNSVLYVTFPPCHQCCAAVIQAHIRGVVCPDPNGSPERWRKSFLLGADLLKEAGVWTTHYYDD